MTTIDLGTRRSVAARKPLRLTERGRRVLAVLVAIPLVMLALWCAFIALPAVGSDQQGQAEYVEVQSGQTLWEIAGQVAPEQDPREVVYEIRQANHLQDATVHPGTELLIPASALD